MAIDIKFDLAGNPEAPTIILATRSGKKLGQLDVNADSINLIDKFNEPSEFAFTLNKYIDENLTNLWDKVVDFKLVYCKEWDMWFEITVEINQEDETVKTVTCTQLGQAELSQIMLYDIEINTEADIERDDYKISILYNESDPEASILNRLLEKAPHYSIDYVDPIVARVQRSFSFDDKSIYDAFQEISEEIGCLFVYNSNSDENGKIQRTISVYDLWYSCSDCGYRNESEGYFVDKYNTYLTDEFDNILTDELWNYLLYRKAVQCPKCGGQHIKKGYGDDTLIFVTSDELASSGIQLTSDDDSVKNCFKLEAGDDLMTATVRNCNPNGTDYIWHFSEDIKDDMSDELVNKINAYDEAYGQYYNQYISDIDVDLSNRYNELVDKYSVYNKDLQKIKKSVVGYQELMNAYYNTIDLVLYLKSSLMPNIEMSKTSAKEQAKLLTVSSLSPIAVANINTVSLATADSTVLAMAKIIVESTYKVQINTSELIVNGSKKSWKGNFVITNYSDEEDTAISNVISVVINDNMETFIEQKIEKSLSKENTDDLSISGLFEKDYNDFCLELKKYALNPLISFRDACQTCIDILIEQGVNINDGWYSEDGGSSGNLYENLYIPYYNKLKAIENEIKIREDEISIISGIYDSNNVLITEGLQTNIEKLKSQIQNALDFEKYLGTELWLEFSAYRREDKYSNDNYISDGLNNAELFKRALDFFETAESEIYKSSELQHSISTTLNNLLAMPKFNPITKSFKVGNWIRIQIDDKIYRLRLLEYEIDFGDFDTISVEFSDAVKIKNGITDVKSVLSQASSMATSYSSVRRQASQGEKSNTVLNNWFENGLNATNAKIISTENQNQIWNKSGILCREYDQITNEYSDEQLRIINSTIAITDDNWETTKTAIGKYHYIDPHTKELKVAYGVNGETIVGKLLIGEELSISNSSGDLQFGTDGFIVENGINTVAINPSSESIFNISNNSGNIFTLNERGQLVIVGDITASNLTLIDGTKIETDNITGLSDVAISGEYEDLEGVPTKLSNFTNDSGFITKSVSNLTNYYKKTEVDNSLKTKVDTGSLSAVATSGSYNDLTDIEELKNWVLEQIKAVQTNKQ